MRKVTSAALSALAAMTLFGVGCASSHQEGVKSDLRSQWIDVYADVETTTAAAKQVLSDDKLTDVSAQATKLDGMASGVTADKTKIQVKITQAERGSQVSVTVGTIGSPTIGAQYAAKIKQVAEKK